MSLNEFWLYKIIHRWTLVSCFTPCLILVNETVQWFGQKCTKFENILKNGRWFMWLTARKVTGSCRKNSLIRNIGFNWRILNKIEYKIETFQPHARGGGLTEKNEKEHEILAFKPLLQEMRLKNLTVRKIFWSSNILALKEKKCCQSLQKWGRIKLYSPPYGFIKNLQQIHLRDYG